MNYHQWPHYVPPYVRPMQNGMGIAALLLGLFSLPFSIVPLLGFACWPFAVIGMILGVTGATKARNGLATNGGMALTGAWLSCASFVMPIFVLVAIEAR